ncbi:Ig-like domain-containing protein, partial [Hafnia alvei]|uniref:invasin domain 3-containing protein n=1 Tax=Hafnia alvei TaxID=569 RepID=UPI002DBE63CD
NVATPTTTTDAQGVATTTLTSTKAGSFTVNAEVNGKQSAVEVNFVTSPPVANKSTLTYSYSYSGDTILTAPQVSDATLTLKLNDAVGNPVSGQNVKFVSSHVDSSVSDVVDNGDGTYTAKVTATRTGLLTGTGSVDTVITTLLDGKSFGLTATLKISRGSYSVPLRPNYGNSFSADEVAADLEKYETLYYRPLRTYGSIIYNIELPLSAITGSAVRIVNDSDTSTRIVYDNSTIYTVITGANAYFVYDGTQWKKSS